MQISRWAHCQRQVAFLLSRKSVYVFVQEPRIQELAFSCKRPLKVACAANFSQATMVWFLQSYVSNGKYAND